MRPAFLLIAALQGVPVGVDRPDTVVVRADSAALATAYADSTARELVRRARGRREQIDASVFHYTALSRQRISVGLRALRRDRILYRRESASRVEWWRDRPGRVEVLGAREAVPIALPDVQVPEELEDWVREFVPRPGGDRLLVSPGGDGFAWHPLMEGGEALYRYSTGDTTVIRLPDDAEVRLVELRVEPRERDFRRVTGSFWIALDDYAIVQAVFRPSRDFDFERDATTFGEDSADIDEIPGPLKPVQFDVRYVTIEYGLWEMRWWMPRLFGFEGELRMGVVRAPFSIQVAYSEYTVAGDRYGLPELPPVIRELAGDPYAEPRPYETPMRVVVPDDTTALLTSRYLPESIYSEADPLISRAEIRRLGERVGSLPAPPWEVGHPTLTPPWAIGKGLARYNRVEGLSVGARVEWDLTRLQADLTGRIGLADGIPRLQLGLDLPRYQRTWRAAGYWRRLAAADPSVRPFGVANSFTALLFGRDDGQYFETSGGEIAVSPVNGAYEVRFYGEHQESAPQASSFRLLKSGGGFRENLPADEADQLGVSAALRVNRGADPTGFRWGAWLDLTGETGTFTFLRPGAGFRGSAPLIGPVLGGVELAAGTSFHAEEDGLPAQSLWYLGGPATLRGFPGGYIGGADFGRLRLELSTRLPAARVALFSDAGWAGVFDAFDSSDVAVSAGVGASIFDGLLRMDLARAVHPEHRWRVELYLDALF